MVNTLHFVLEGPHLNTVPEQYLMKPKLSIQYNTIQYNTIQYNTIQYNTIQYNTIQYKKYNTMQFRNNHLEFSESAHGKPRPHRMCSHMASHRVCTTCTRTCKNLILMITILY